MNQTITKTINDYSYLDNEELEEIIIPEGVESIGERAFSNCKNLRKVTLPSTLKTIGPSAFQNCESLEEITIPSNVKSISYRAFANCKRLKRIIIPEGVEDISWAAFADCENLEEIVLPNSLKSIGKQLFLNCKKLKKVTLPNSITSLPDELFKGCENLDIVLGENIKELGNSVFQDCYKLTTFPSHITRFGNDCFKNCRGITTATLNSNITQLNDGLFDGCTNLKEINTDSPNKILVGQRVFRNCKNLKEIPSFIKNYNRRLFENCEGLREISLIGNEIPFACFRGCTNLKTINNLDSIRKIDSFAFSGCKGLTEIDLSNISEIRPEILSNCINLRRVHLPEGIKKIGSRAFFNCQNLKEINWPDSIERIDKEAFRNCNSLEEIIIPGELRSFGDKAFSYMKSLKRINVSPRNRRFTSPDHKILVDEDRQTLVLYASGLEDKEYTLEKYVVDSETFKGQTIIRPIVYIGDYAFAGASHLQELTVCGCTKDIEKTAFEGCDKLKKLNVISVEFSSCPGFTIRDRGRHYFNDEKKEKCPIPFEHVEFRGNIVNIFPRALENFKNVTQVTLGTEENYNISSYAFTDCPKLAKIDIPEQVLEINRDSFAPQTELNFTNGIKVDGFIELTHKKELLGDYKMYTVSNGTFYIEQNGKVTQITKEYIDRVCSHSELIRDNPILFLDFMNSLLENNLGKKELFNGILMSCMSNESREILLQSLKPDDTFFMKILRQSGLLDKDDDETKKLLKDNNFGLVVRYIEEMRKRNLEDRDLSQKIVMANLPPDSFVKLLDTDLDLFRRVIRESKLIEDINKSKVDKDIATQILRNDTISKFMFLITKYGIKDKYLFNKAFISIANNPLFEELLKVYDANTKRVLKMSLAADKLDTAPQNIEDLLTLMKITGALNQDPVIRQQAATFLCEKIFEKTLPTGKENGYRIVGDDIHRVFNFQEVREELDEEFTEFFRENYQQLVEEERTKSGFIQRAYKNFREISRTATSNKGSQRKLKVTIDKCKGYLSEVKFDGVTPENKDFAMLMGAWYDENRSWEKAQIIYNESLKAPRNIFTKVMFDDDGNKIYDNNPEHDLKDKEEYPYTYEWLPKQKYENLILGKHCNCCAHVEGAGQGIVRASMILDNCQNLVIKNRFGEIISKATLYVNKKQGYAVFNTVETSLNYRSDEDLQEIYKAFMRGAEAFLEAYNKNNPEYPILCMTIGGKRNTILDYMDTRIHPQIEVKESIHYGHYALLGHGYDGDWNSGQRVVLQKK